MDKLVGERSRLGIHTIDDLAAYYRAFYTITSHLVTKNRLSETEQSRAFVRGFQAELWARVGRRLEIKYPDHHADDAYSLDEVYQAASHILQGTSPTALPQHPTSTPRTEPESQVKNEDISAILGKLALTIQALVNMQVNGGATSTARPPPMHTNNHNNLSGQACNFCGQLGHFMSTCPLIIVYINAGKCRKNHEGKLVLPSGAWMPKSIIGRTFQERFDEYHRQNPNQLAGAHITSNTNATNTNIITDATSMLYGCTPATTRNPLPASSGVEINALRLTAQERINALEKELFVLKGRQVFDGVEIVRRKEKGKEREQNNEASSTSGTKDIHDAIPTLPATEPIAKPPIHPFANIPEAQYAPPTTRNFAAPFDKTKVAKDREPAYRTQAPAQNAKITEDVYSRSVKAPFVTLSTEELLALSPDYRQKVRDSVTPKRIATDVVAEALSISTHLQEEARLPFINEVTESAPSNTRSTIPPASMAGREAYVIPDVYETYLSNLAPGEHAEELTVAKESHAIRSVMMMVDHQEQVETILDGGSQIIAMSDSVCHELGLSYDPTIRLNMQSTNGTIDKSLGLS